MDFKGVHIVCALGIAGLLLGATRPSHGYYEDAEVTAIRFGGERAAASGEPLTLLAHQSAYHMFSNGPRRVAEHKLWHIADPADPKSVALQQMRIPVNRMIETVGVSRCRIFRGADTLEVPAESWHLAVPAGWPEQGADPWRELCADLPPFAAGDVVELAYTIENQWNPGLYPSDWLSVPIRAADIPTMERHILVEYNRAMQRMARIKVIGDATPLRRHHGRNRPMIELLTGNLPAGPSDPLALDAPRLLFTSHDTWRVLGLCLQKQYGGFLYQAEEAFSDQGDSLSAALRASRERFEGVLRYVEEHFARIPEPLLHSSYYPRQPRVLQIMHTAKPLERALLIAGLGGAARIRVDTYLARPDDGNFDPAFPMPMQFDRVILAVSLVDEDRVVYIDPARYPLAAAIESTQENLLLYDFLGSDQYFYRFNDEGRLDPVEF